MWTLVKLWLGKAYDFLKPSIALFLSQSGQILATAALRAVSAVAESAISGDRERRDAAFDLIVEDLKAQGVKAGASAINLAIETAVVRLKGE